MPRYVTHDHIRLDSRVKGEYLYYYFMWVPKSEEELKKSLGDYHRDTYNYNIVWYMNQREYYSRAKDNIEMQKLNSWKGYDEYLFTEKNRNFPFYY